MGKDVKKARTHDLYANCQSTGIGPIRTDSKLPRGCTDASGLVEQVAWPSAQTHSDDSSDFARSRWFLFNLSKYH